MTINPHIMKAIAERRIADLHRGAVPRPEPKPRATRTLGRKQATRRTRGLPAARPE